MLPVNEIFETLQGEATWTGTPSTFVRLQSCDVGCPWCDTKHTWGLDGPKIDPVAMLAKHQDAPTYAELSTQQLIDTVRDFKPRHIVFTGGEPCIYDLWDATFSLIERGYSVQIETSGTYEIKVEARTWITLSPKIDMPGGKVVLPRSIHRAQEIKMPVGKPADIRKLVALIGDARPAGGIWLQPLSQSKKATALCIAEAAARGWKVSLQCHKFAGLR